MFRKKIVYIIISLFLLANLISIISENNNFSVQANNSDNIPPLADAGGPYSQFAGEPVIVDASASYDPDGEVVGYRYDWDGDGNWDTCFCSDSIRVITYYGEFHGNIIVEVKDNKDLTDTDSATVDITVDISADAGGPYVGEVAEDIQFYGNAHDGVPPIRYSWDFGDGNASNEQNPTHNYSNPSPEEGYEVFLYVSDSEGKNDWDKTQAFITEEESDPIANANGPYVGTINETIELFGSAYGGTEPYLFSWDFDNSNGIQEDSYEQNPSFIYDLTGIYKATLTITDDNGKTDNDTATVLIEEEEPPEDTTPPNIEIIKPVNGLYLGNNRIISLNVTFIIGAIDIDVNATDDGSGINRVEFFIDETLQETVDSIPYKWTWDNTVFFKHTIMVTAYDNAENSKSIEMSVWKFL